MNMKKCAYLLLKMSCLILAINLLVAGGSPRQADAATKVKPTSIKRITKASSNAIKLRWKRIKSASGYKVYRSTSKNGKYRCIATVKNRTTYKDKVQINKEYFYKIKVYKKVNGKKYYSNNSVVYKTRLNSSVNKSKTKKSSKPNKKTNSTNVGKTVINHVYTTKDNKLKVCFEEVPDITGYKIYRVNSRANEDYKLIKRINADNEYYIDSTVKYGKTYMYKIQAYKIVEHKEYVGDFSNELEGVTRYVGDSTEYESESDNLSNEILKILNNHRVSLGLNSLKMTQKLNKVAEIRAKEIKTLYSHTRPNGTKYSTAYEEIDVASNYIAENLMYGVNTAQAFFDAWYNSPGHRRNMENPEFKRVGIAIYVDENGTIYCSQNFAE